MTEEDIMDEEKIKAEFLEIHYKVNELWAKKYNIEALQSHVDNLGESINGIKAMYAEYNKPFFAPHDSFMPEKMFNQFRSDINLVKSDVVNLKHRFTDLQELQRRLNKDYSLLGALSENESLLTPCQYFVFSCFVSLGLFLFTLYLIY